MPEISLNGFQHTTYIILLVIWGAIFLLNFFILLVFIKSKEKIYLYYSLFLTCCLVGSTVHIVGLGWIDDGRIGTILYERRILESFTFIALFFYCVFSITLLEIKKQDPKLAKWITFLALITAIYGILYWPLYPFIKDMEVSFFMISRAIIMPMCLVAIIWVSYKIQSIFKNYFIIGSGFYFTGAFLAIFRETNIQIPFKSFYSISSTTYFQAGIFFEVICFTLALSLRVYLIYQSKQDKTKKERDLALSKVLASQTQNNSHLIFNSLNVIKYLIQTQKKEAALSQLSIYSKFIRNIIESAQKQQISLRKEISIVNSYLELEATRLDYSFDDKIYIDNAVDLDRTMLPPMLLQSFVEKFIWKRNYLNPNFYIFKNNINETIILLINETLDFTSNEELNEFIDKNYEYLNYKNERILLYNKNHNDKIYCYHSNQINNASQDFSICIKISDKNHGFSNN